MAISQIPTNQWNILVKEGTINFRGATLTHKNLEGDLNSLMLAFERALKADSSNASLQFRMEEAWDTGNHTGTRKDYWDKKILELKNDFSKQQNRLNRLKNQELIDLGLFIPGMKQSVLDTIHAYKLSTLDMINSPFTTPEDPAQCDAERKLIRNSVRNKSALYTFQSHVNNRQFDAAINTLRSVGTIRDQKLAIRFLSAEQKPSLPKQLVNAINLCEIDIAAAPLETPEDLEQHEAERLFIRLVVTSPQAIQEFETIVINKKSEYAITQAFERIGNLQDKQLAVRYLRQEQKDDLPPCIISFLKLSEDVLAAAPFENPNRIEAHFESSFIEAAVDQNLLRSLARSARAQKSEEVLASLKSMELIQQRKLAIRYLEPNVKALLKRDQIEPLLQPMPGRNVSLLEGRMYHINNEGLIELRNEEETIPHTHFSGNLDQLLKRYSRWPSIEKAECYIARMIEIWDTRVGDGSTNDWESTIERLQNTIFAENNQKTRSVRQSLKKKEQLDLNKKQSVLNGIDEYGLSRESLIEGFLKNSQYDSWNFPKYAHLAAQKFIRNAGLDKRVLYRVESSCEGLAKIKNHYYRPKVNVDRFDSEEKALLVIRNALQSFSSVDERKLAIRYLREEACKALTKPEVWDQIKDLLES